MGGELGMRVLGLRPAHAVLDNPLTPLSVTFSFGLTFAALFVLEMSRIVGGRRLRDLGRRFLASADAFDRLDLDGPSCSRTSVHSACGAARPRAGVRGRGELGIVLGRRLPPRRSGQ